MSSLNIFLKSVEPYSVSSVEGTLLKVFLAQNHIPLTNLSPFLLKIYKQNDDKINGLIKRQKIKVTLKFIEHVFEALIDFDQKKENGVVFTPNFVGKHLIKEMTSHLKPENNSKVIDPACGGGSLLVVAAEEIMKKTGSKAKNVVENQIFGLDIDTNNIRHSKITLSLLILLDGQIPDETKMNLKVADSLKEDWGKVFKVDNYDYIIGNPPYVNTHDLPKDSIVFLKNNFSTTTKGTFNIFFAFIEKAIAHIAPSGQIGFVIPNNYLTITAAEQLRIFLQKESKIRRIVDFGENMIFYPVRTYNSLLFLQGTKTKYVEHAIIPKTDNVIKTLGHLKYNKSLMADFSPAGWNLLTAKHREQILSIENHKHKLKNYIHTGIATLKDAIYIMDGLDSKQNLFYKEFSGKKYFLEKEVVKPLYKISDIKDSSNLETSLKYILCPYKQVLINGISRFSIIKESELRSKYPLTYSYLQARKPELDARDKGKYNPNGWYSYGRGQGLNFSGRKLLFPTFSSKPKFMLEQDADNLFCNGYAIVEDKNSKLTLEVLQKILNSNVMNYYIEKTSYSIEGGYRCYQKKYIQNFSIPSMTEKDMKFLEEENDKNKLNVFLAQKYNISI